MESIADGDPQADPVTMVDDDGNAPSSLLSSDQANGTLIEYSAPPKRYSWYQPYKNPEAIRQIMVQKYGCTLGDDTKERSKRNDAAKKIDWLCPELRAKVDGCAPVMGTDIDGNGKVDEAKLMELLKLILGDLRLQAYCNIYQLRDLVQFFAASWGFHVKIRQCNIVCHYGTDTNRSDEYAKRADAEEVTPSKKRKRSAPASAKQCTFKIEALFIDNDEASKKLERWSRPVKIKIANLNLCHTCGCSALQQTYARKNSGFYTKNISEDELEHILELMESGCTSTNVFRRMMERLGFKGGIQAVDVHNLKVRAQQLRVSGKKLSIDEAKNWIRNPGLAETFEAVGLDNDHAVARAKELLRSVIQDSGELWEAEALLRKLKETDPKFDYRIMYDNQTGRPIGLVYTTKIMRDAFVRFGRIISLDAMLRQYNSLHWPYIGPVILDEEWQIVPVCEMLVISESHAAYAFAMNFLFELEPQMKSQVHVLFSDCGLTDNFLDLIGLSRETTQLFWDHWHLLNKVWPKFFGITLYAAHLKEPLTTLCKATTREKFDAAYLSAGNGQGILNT